MANPNCTMCGQEPGELMATSLNDGDTVVIGGNCLPAYALGMAAAFTQGMDADASEAYGEAFDAIAANDARPKMGVPPAAASEPRKGRRKSGAVLPPLPDDTGQPEPSEPYQPSHDADGSTVQDDRPADASTAAASNDS